MTIDELNKVFTTDKVFVFSKNNCPDCLATKNRLKRNNVDFQEIRIDTEENQEILEYIKGQGFRKAPVVFANGEAWQGFDMQKIDSIN